MNRGWKIKKNPLNDKLLILENLALLNNEQITHDLLPQKFGRRGKIWVAILILFCVVGAYAYSRQLQKHLLLL